MVHAPVQRLARSLDGFSSCFRRGDQIRQARRDVMVLPSLDTARRRITEIVVAMLFARRV